MANGTHNSIGTLFSALMQDMSLLIRKEIELARTEISQKVSDMGSGAIYLAVGGALAFLALQFALAAAVFALAMVLPAWAATLVVAGAVLFVGLLFLAAGIGKFRLTHLKPERTVRTLRDDAAFARQQLRARGG